jgi:hypothetical protein
VAPGARVWLPLPLAGSVRMQWRPAGGSIGGGGGGGVKGGGGGSDAVKGRLSVSGVGSMPNMQSATDAATGPDAHGLTTTTTAGSTAATAARDATGHAAWNENGHAWSEPLQLRTLASVAEAAATTAASAAFDGRGAYHLLTSIHFIKPKLSCFISCCH